MKQAKALAMLLFDTYSEMEDEEQAQALATLRTVDPGVHDALVQLLVTDVLDHTLDARPWLASAVPAPADDDVIEDPPSCDGS